MTARRLAFAAVAVGAAAVAVNHALTRFIDRLATDLIAPPHQETTR